MHIQLEAEDLVEALGALDFILNRAGKQAGGLEFLFTLDKPASKLIIEGGSSGHYAKATISCIIFKEGQFAINVQQLRGLELKKGRVIFRVEPGILHFTRGRFTGHLETTQSERRITAMRPLKAVPLKDTVSHALLSSGVGDIFFTSSSTSPLCGLIKLDGSTMTCSSSDEWKGALFRAELPVPVSTQYEFAMELSILHGILSRLKCDSLRIGLTNGILRLASTLVDVHVPTRQVALELQQVEPFVSGLKPKTDAQCQSIVNFYPSEAGDAMSEAASVVTGALGYEVQIDLYVGGDASGVEEDDTGDGEEGWEEAGEEAEASEGDALEEGGEDEIPFGADQQGDGAEEAGDEGATVEVAESEDYAYVVARSSVGSGKSHFGIYAAQYKQPLVVTLSSRYASEFVSLLGGVTEGLAELQIWDNWLVFRALDLDLTYMMPPVAQQTTASSPNAKKSASAKTAKTRNASPQAPKAPKKR